MTSSLRDGSAKLRVVPLELSEANGLVLLWHRHHKPSQGHRFSLGCIEQSTGRLCGTGKELGYLSIQTYILEEEHGVTLRASGWICEGIAGGGQWKHTDGKPRRTDQPTGMKTRWRRVLNSNRSSLVFPNEQSTTLETLYG